MTDLATFHPLHAAGFGLAAAAAAKALGFENDQAVVAGAVVGGGTYAYMATYGHALPWDSGVSAISAKMPPGGSPATPLKQATNVWADIQASAMKQGKAFEASMQKTAAQFAAAKTATDTKAAASKKGIPQFFSPLSGLF